jgi:hypothetical protein
MTVMTAIEIVSVPPAIPAGTNEEGDTVVIVGKVW